MSRVQLLEVNSSPTIAQYVSLLEAICSSSTTPTAEMLQDVSVLYARLGEPTHTAGLPAKNPRSHILEPSRRPVTPLLSDSL